jgi:hypothetical protein
MSYVLFRLWTETTEDNHNKQIPVKNWIGKPLEYEVATQTSIQRWLKGFILSFANDSIKHEWHILWKQKKFNYGNGRFYSLRNLLSSHPLCRKHPDRANLIQSTPITSHIQILT